MTSGAPEPTVPGPDPAAPEVPGAPAGAVPPPDAAPPGHAAGGTTPRVGHRRRGRQGSLARELPVLLVVAVGLALLIKTFLVQAFYIPSGSMERTLLIGDRVLVNKLVYHLRSIHRGEIVVFDTKGTNFASASEALSPPPTNGVAHAVQDVQCFLGLGCPGETDFIKRVIAIPGDRISCCDPLGRVVVDGHPLQETYVYQNDFEPFCAGPTAAGPPSHTCPSGAPPVVVQKGMLFVMGDHRGNSADSRTYGQVPETKVVGRAFLRIWPPSRIAFLRVPATFNRALSAAAPAAPLLAAAAVVVPGALLPARRRRRRRRPPG